MMCTSISFQNVLELSGIFAKVPTVVWEVGFGVKGQRLKRNLSNEASAQLEAKDQSSNKSRRLSQSDPFGRRLETIKFSAEPVKQFKESILAYH